MTAAVPENKSNELLREMNRLIVEQSVDPFTISRIKREIDNLKKISVVDGLVVQSGLFVLEKDFDAALSETRKLLRQWPKNDWVVINAEVTLNRIGRLTELADEIIRIAMANPSEFNLLWLALKTAYISGQLSQIEPISEQMKRLGKDALVDEVVSMHNQLKDQGITDANTQQIAEFAYAALRNYNGGMFLGRAIHVIPDWMMDEFGDSWLANRIYISSHNRDEEGQHIFALNDEVSVGLADEQFRGNPALNRFLIDFVLEELPNDTTE